MLLLLAFYASSPMDTGVASSAIDSIFGFLVLVLLAGGSPAASHFLLLRQKKSNQRKGDPTVCVPSLRYGQPAVLGPAGGSLELASLRQSRSLIRLALRSSAHTEGLGDRDWSRERIQMRVRGLAPSPFGGRLGWGPAEVRLQQVNPSIHLKTAYRTEISRPRAYSKSPHPNLPPAGEGVNRLSALPNPIPPRPGWACDAPKNRDQGRALFEPQASLRGPPLFWRSAGCPKRSVGTQTAGRLSFGYFSLAKQRKVTSRRATPGQQPSEKHQNPRTRSALLAGASK
jgi:hypothetical protein